MATSDITKLEKKMDKRFDEMMALMSNFANDVNDRFDGVDKRLDAHDRQFVAINARLDDIEIGLDKLEASHSRLLNTIDGFVKRIDDYEPDLSARYLKT
jgi:predicted  nucleic acid-binding Zn-ribbon protein